MKKYKKILYGAAAVLIIAVLALSAGKLLNGNNTRTPSASENSAGDESETDVRGLAQTGQVYDPGNSALRFAEGMTPASKKGFTVMIYMIGSNLESSMGKATADLEEISASAYDTQTVNVIVYTGGSRRWTGDIPSETNCIIDMSLPEGDRIVAQTDSNADMGAPGTLSDFINFCDFYYPADRHGLILWDHGGGPLSGYGADELFEYDSLLLTEMQAAMRQTGFSGNRKLDFVGFDACIMACIENMNIWKDHADYFIGSEELEPGDGWDYSFLGTIKADTGTEEICGEVIDRFGKYYEARVSDSYDPDLSLSCIDLGRLDALNDRIDVFSEKCLNAVKKGDYPGIAMSRAEIKGVAKAAESDKEGGMDSYDIIDIGDMAEKLSWIGSSECEALRKGISDTVVKNYSNVDGLNGITMYFPFGNKSQYRSKQKDYEEVAVSRNYRNFLQKTSGEWLAERQAGWKLAEPQADEKGSYVELTEEQAENIVSASYSIIGQNDFFGYFILMEDISILPDEEGRLYLPDEICLMQLKEAEMICTVREIEASDVRRVYCTDGVRVSDNPLFIGGIMTGSCWQDVQIIIIDNGEELVIQSVNAKDENILSAGKDTVDLGDWSELRVLTKGIFPLWDADGQLLPVSEWPAEGMTGWRSSCIDSDTQFELVPLSDVSGSFKAQIQVEDIYGDVYASDLIELDAGTEIKKEIVKTAAGELVFSVYEDHAVCEDYYGDEEEVTIAAEVDGKPVTMIGVSAFSGPNRISTHQALKSVILPDSVTSIESSAFCGCKALEDINIPEGVTVIGPGAFQDCVSLNSIELPAGLSVMGIGVFTGCEALEEIKLDAGNRYFLIKDDALYSKDGKILYAYPAAKTGSFTVPDGTEEIGYAAFSASDLKEVVFPNSLIKINDFAFYNAKLTAPPSFPDKLAVIGNNAFSCDAGTIKQDMIADEPVTIGIGPGVRKIGTDAFELFPAREFEVNPDNRYFSSREGCLVNKAGDILVCVALRKEKIIRVPEGVVEFEPKCIGNLRKLNSWDLIGENIHILIPDSVVRFGDNALITSIHLIINCTPGSEAVRFAQKNDVTVEYTPENDIFPESTGEMTIDTGILRYELYSDHAVIVYCEVPEKADEESETVIELPASIEGKPVTVIGNGKWSIFDEEGADYRYRSYDRLIIPDGVTKLADRSVSCAKEVILPEGLKDIGNNAINLTYGCTPLVIPETVENLGENFIQGNVSEEFVIGTALKNISPKAFGCCGGLKCFVTDGSNPLYSVKEGALYSADGTVLVAACDGMESIPEGTVKIAEYAFYRRKGIKELKLPVSLEEIDSHGFAECSGIEKLVFPAGSRLKAIGDSAFCYCSALAEISLPDTVTELGVSAFSACQSLQKAVLSNGLSAIPSNTFSGCKQLTDISFGDNITFIDYYAFSGCSSLRDFFIPEGVTDISYSVFSGDENIIITVDPDNPYYEVKDGLLIDKRRQKVIAYDGSITSVVRVPEGIVDIGSVFSDLKGITDIYLPESVISISSLPKVDTDEGYRYALVIHGTEGSYAQRYAYDKDIEFR